MVVPEELADEEEYEDILEDIRDIHPNHENRVAPDIRHFFISGILPDIRFRFPNNRLEKNCLKLKTEDK